VGEACQPWNTSEQQTFESPSFSKAGAFNFRSVPSWLLIFLTNSLRVKSSVSEEHRRKVKPHPL